MCNMLLFSVQTIRTTVSVESIKCTAVCMILYLCIHITSYILYELENAIH